MCKNNAFFVLDINMPETTPIGPCVALQEALEACVKTNVCFSCNYMSHII